MMFDALQIARGWLAVAVASGTDRERPTLSRTVYIEAHTGGVRLVSTDSTVLLHAWVPDLDHEWEPEPDLDEAPRKTAIAIDPHGRAKGFLAHALKLATADGAPPIEVRLRLDVAAPDPQAPPTLDGMEARYVVLEQPDVERLKLQTCEGTYPAWRNLLDNFRPELTTQIALAPDLVGRLAKIGKIHPFARLGWRFGGENKAAALTVLDSDPHVAGIVMPVRWDLDTNSPRVDDVVAEAAAAGEVDDDQADGDGEA